MAIYIETWKGIAFAVGRSARWCRYMAQRTLDPLPVFKVGGTVKVKTSDLAVWMSRQYMEPPQFDTFDVGLGFGVEMPLKLSA